MHKLIGFSAASALLAVTALPAAAQTAPMVSKTWVSSTGSDTGSCQLVAPCKSFAYAISETNAGGEIDVKDSGAYGGFEITKSISIVADGVVASVGLGQSGDAGINITASDTDVVSIHGLTVNTHNDQKSSIVINCNYCHVVLDHVIAQGSRYGINNRSINAFVMVSNSLISNNYYGLSSGSGLTYLNANTITINTEGVTGYFKSYQNNAFNGNTSCDICDYSLISAQLQ